MNFILPIIVLTFTTYLGFGFASYYKMRNYIFEDLILFCNVLENNISYNMSLIKEVITNNLSSFKSDFKNILKKYLALIEKQENIEYEKIKKEVTSFYLENDELKSVQNLLFNLGKTSVENEIKLITSFKKIFESYKQEGSLKNKKNYSMSIKLGFLLGLCLVIFIV